MTSNRYLLVPLLIALIPGPAAADRPHVVTRVSKDRAVLERVDPEYSEAARKRKLEGEVHLQVRVGPGGKIVPAGYPLRGDYELSYPALQAVRSWTFAPADTETWVWIDMSFRLDLAPVDLFAYDGSITVYHLGRAHKGADLGKFEGHEIRDWSVIGNVEYTSSFKKLLPTVWPEASPATSIQPPRSPDWAFEIRTQADRNVALYASTQTGEVYLRDEDRAWTMKDPTFVRALAPHFATLLH